MPEAASWLTRRPFQPCSSAHSFRDCCQPTTCHIHEPPAEPRPPTARVARQTTLRAFSIRDPGSSTDLNPPRLPILGRDMSKALKRVELRDGETISKILSGLPHSRGDRAPSLHNRERVDKTVGSGRTAGSIADRPFQALDDAVIAPLRRWHNIGNCRDWLPEPRTFLRHPSLRTNHEHLGQKISRTACSSRFRNCRVGCARCRARRPPTALARASTSRRRSVSALLPHTMWQRE